MRSASFREATDCQNTRNQSTYDQTVNLELTIRRSRMHSSLILAGRSGECKDTTHQVCGNSTVPAKMSYPRSASSSVAQWGRLDGMYLIAPVQDLLDGCADEDESTAEVRKMAKTSDLIQLRVRILKDFGVKLQREEAGTGGDFMYLEV